MEAIRSIAGPVADVIRTAVGAFTSLPPDIQKLLVAGFAVNKLTGGLVTNIAGGIFGALKAMTVRASIVNVSGGVVNGGGAGGPGVVGGGTSKLVKGLAGLSILADIGAVIATQQAVSGESSAQAQAVTETARVYLASSPTTDQLAMSLAAVDTGIDRLQSNPLYVLVQGSALDELRKTRAAIVAQIAAQGSANGSEDRPMNSPTPVVKNTSKTVSAVEAAKAAIAVASKLAAAKAAAQQAKLEATRQAINIGSSSAKSSAGNIASRVSAAGAATASALRNLPVPIVTTTVNVSVTASGISKTVTTQSRYGPATGSSSGDPRFLGYTPGL